MKTGTMFSQGQWYEREAEREAGGHNKPCLHPILPRGQPVEIPTLVIHHEWICQKYTPMKNYPKRAGNFKIASLLASKVLMRRACERASQGPIEVRRSTRQALPSRDSPSGKVAYIHAPLSVRSMSRGKGGGTTRALRVRASHIFPLTLGLARSASGERRLTDPPDGAVNVCAWTQHTTKHTGTRRLHTIIRHG